ncbi:MAG: 16S rRNA (adenine(1518)-N(6)/adenine(1519)-N(6))-dimethyltransferase RsmA, partial [Bacteroidales bacterium]|nr:16S rRNA (adenine(1518)-N(6)/adenine(1519)-N(6))-dimethyltransferase RsmA [Bacteroidales bacterium]
MNRAKYTQRAKRSDEVHIDFNDKVRAKKNLGQHFLTDLSIAEKIADTVSEFCAPGTLANASNPPLPCLEVGPGMGVLTQFLIDKGYNLKVVELDGESVSYLRLHYPSSLENRIIEADFLKLDLSSADVFGNQPFCLIGNYPYNISSQIFFKVIDYRDQIPCCSGMIQKEVAERMAAAPGSKAYGILSVLVQVWYNIEYCFTVGNHVFNPPPKVQSAVIRMVRNDMKQLPCEEKDLRTLVKNAFGMRRKTLRNCLRQ